MNEFKGGSISDMLDMLEQNSDNIQGVDRTAVLKDITTLEKLPLMNVGGLKPSFLSQVVVLVRFVSQIRGRPAIGRDVVTSDLGNATGNKRPKKDSFFNQLKYVDQLILMLIAHLKVV